MPAPVQEVTLTGVEETLRLAREELEHEIARMRVGLLLGTTLLSMVAIGLGTIMGGDAPLPLPFYFLVLTGIAWYMRNRLRATGPTPILTYGGITLDVVAFSASAFLSSLWETNAEIVDGLFIAWIGTGIMAILIYLHALRSDRRALVYTAVISSIATALIFVSAPYPVVDKSLVVMEPTLYAMPRDAFFPLLIMTVGTVGLTVALAFFADGHARRRLRIHAKVLRYVPDAAVEHVTRETTDAGIRAPGRLVEVTILASDLRGFTAMSEKMPPQEVVNQLNQYHDAMCREIERHGGMLDKLIGDGELAVFGWKTDAPDAGAEAAVRCARAMREALTVLNASRATRGLPALAMGVGIHTGMCVAGNIGAGKKLSFTYIGDAVNAASRVEGLTKDLGVPVLATEDTVKRLPSRAGLRELGPTAIRGRTETVVLHAVE